MIERVINKDKSALDGGLMKSIIACCIFFILPGCATWDNCGWYHGSYVYEKCQKGEEISTFDKIMGFVFNESTYQAIGETIESK